MRLFKKLVNYCKRSDVIQHILQIRRDISGTKETIDIMDYYLIWQIQKALSEANHVQVRYLSVKLVERGCGMGLFYEVQSLLLQNKVTQSEEKLHDFLLKNPYHAEATYLMAEIQLRKYKKENAINLLENLLQYSTRRKTWQHLANLIETLEDFQRYQKKFSQYYPDYLRKPLKYDLICHLSNAAIRAGQVDFALNLWRRQYQYTQTYKVKHNLAVSSKYTDEKAAVALSALKEYLDLVGIPFFLISGTLLGCIRENKLLGHDKDIDVGVWDEYTPKQLQTILQSSGCFYTLPIYSSNILVIRHCNGITIDIFIHYREENDFWHAGKKNKWHNSPFELIPHYFLGNYYLIPKNYDLYLTENYGSDWHIPQLNFDSTLDAPNVEIFSRDEFIIYLYKQLLSPKGIKLEIVQRLQYELKQQKETI